MKDKKVIVCGAGASGMVAAIMAAIKGHKVTILEANEKPGKKIYATGNGKCNLTNSLMSSSCFRGTNDEFINDIIGRFGYDETILFFKELGLLFKNKNGYVYPKSAQASSVVECLLLECERVGVNIICNDAVLDIIKTRDTFIVKTSSNIFECDAVILSSGSKAGINSNKLPLSTGYDIAKSFGHKLIPIVPALTGLKCKNKKLYKIVSGVRCDAKITLYSHNEIKSFDEGEIQLTDYGVSGIPVFQICRYAGYSLKSKQDTYIAVDFMPDYEKEDIINLLLYKIKRNPNNTLLEYFNGILNSKLALGFIKVAGEDENTRGYDIRDNQIKRLVDMIKGYKDVVMETNNFQNAQVCAGGVSLNEVTLNMESKLVEGLYITGELLDVDGMCGGYNLQWAWATGYIVGMEI